MLGSETMKLYYPDYNNSILNVTNSILKHYGVKTNYNGIPLLDNELKNNYNHIVYILLDGMGTNIINQHLNEDDALRKYLRKEITSVFPPTTVAATDAVLSGVPPICNGHLGWTQYFKNEDINLVVFRNIDYYTNELYEEANLRDKYLSFKTIYEQINEVSPHVQTHEFFPSFREGGSTSFSEMIDKAVIKVHNTDKSFNYLYWIEPDLSQHDYGPDSIEIKKVLTGLNKDFTSLISNINDDTLIICIADHGLTNVEEVFIYDYPLVTDLLLRKPSLEPRAANFYVKEGKQSEFKILFNRFFSDKFKLYSKQEILDLKLFGEGKPHPLSLDFIGDFIAIATDKYMFTFGESSGFKGHHAGMSKDEMMVPLIMYSNKKL